MHTHSHKHTHTHTHTHIYDVVYASHQWHMPVILATQEAEIRRIKVRSQLRQIVYKTLS
jgi:hypothetical protein